MEAGIYELSDNFLLFINGNTSRDFRDSNYLGNYLTFAPSLAGGKYLGSMLAAFDHFITDYYPVMTGGVEGYTSPFGTSASENSSNKTSFRGWDAMTRATLLTIMTSRIFSTWDFNSEAFINRDLNDESTATTTSARDDGATDSDFNKIKVVLSMDLSRWVDFAYATSWAVDVGGNSRGGNISYPNASSSTTQTHAVTGDDIASEQNVYFNTTAFAETLGGYFKDTYRYLLRETLNIRNIISALTGYYSGVTHLEDAYASLKEHFGSQATTALSIFNEKELYSGLTFENLNTTWAHWKDWTNMTNAFIESGASTSAHFFPDINTPSPSEINDMFGTLRQSKLLDDGSESPDKRIIAVGLPTGMMEYLRGMMGACSLNQPVLPMTTIEISLYKMDLITEEVVGPVSYMFDTSCYFTKTAPILSEFNTEDGFAFQFGNIVEDRVGTEIDGAEALLFEIEDGKIIPRTPQPCTDYDSISLDTSKSYESVLSEKKISVIKSIFLATHIQDTANRGYQQLNYSDFVESGILSSYDELYTHTTSDKEEIFKNHLNSEMLKSYLRYTSGIDLNEISFTPTSLKGETVLNSSTGLSGPGAFDGVASDFANEIFGQDLSEAWPYVMDQYGATSASPIPDLSEEYQHFVENFRKEMTSKGTLESIVQRYNDEASRSLVFGGSRYCNRLLYPRVFERVFCIPIDLSDFDDDGIQDDTASSLSTSRGFVGKYYSIYAKISLKAD